MAKSLQSPRLPELSPTKFTPAQKALIDSIASGPRGVFKMSGPFAIYLHSPEFGELAQKLGGHERLKTSVPPRLSEFAILCTAQFWKAPAEYGTQAVVWQTALNPVVALELLASGVWEGAGVLGPEAFPAVPFLALLAEYGSPHGIAEHPPS